MKKLGREVQPHTVNLAFVNVNTKSVGSIHNDVHLKDDVFGSENDFFLSSQVLKVIDEISNKHGNNVIQCQKETLPEVRRILLESVNGNKEEDKQRCKLNSNNNQFY